MYEYKNERSNVQIKLNNDVTRVVECDLIENTIADIGSDGNKFGFEIKPYEIKTFKIIYR